MRQWRILHQLLNVANLPEPLNGTGGFSSYSALISDRSARPDEPDYDRVYDMTIAPKAVTERTDIFSFPHGAIAGNCIHRIFEKLDFNFTSPEKERGHIRDSLSTYGIDAKWQEVLWDMAQRVVTLPLARSNPGIRAEEHKSRAPQLQFLRDLRAGRVTVNTPDGAIVLPEHPLFWAAYVLVGEP